MELAILLALLLAQAPSLLCDDLRPPPMPSSFLEPPPLSRHYKLPAPHTQIKRMPLIHRPNSRQNNAKLIQADDYWQSKLIPTQIPLAVPQDFSYYHDLQCNPCNSVPWIPIIGYAYPTALPEQPSHSVNIPSSSYFHAMNELSANLIKPINSIPWYMKPTVYPSYPQNQLWLQNTVHQSPEIHTVQESVTQVPHYPAESTVANVGNLGLSQWIDNVKPVPLFHYEHNIDYPTPYAQTAALDLPHQIPQSSLPVPQIPSYSTGAGRYTGLHEGVSEISNHVDDSKYSSSEDKFSFTSNNTNKDSSERSQRVVGNATNLKDYLTPPSATSEQEWLNTGENSHVDVKPLDNWPFIKEIVPKTEKKKKQIQIIIPYTINKSKHMAKNLRDNETKVQQMGAPSTMLPLIRFLKDNGTKKYNEVTDWQKLRKAIDSWTEERFSNHKYNSSVYFSMGLSTLPPSKEIPKTYLRNTISHRDDNDLMEKPDEIQNRVSSGLKNVATSTESSSSKWKSISVSPSTKEKVFIVTPLPITNYSYSSNDITWDSWNHL